MNFLNRLFQWLFVKPARVERYGDPDVYAVDTGKIAREIGLEEEARRMGEANLPASGETELCGIETLILRRVERARQDFLAWGADRLKVLNQEVERRDIAPIVNKAGQADREFERKASSLLAEREKILTELSTAANASAAELDEFKIRHRLNRQAIYPDGTGTFFRVSVLVLLVVIEAALNAVFFAKGLSTGLVGGFVYAGAFAFANVAFACVFGRWMLPNLGHRNPFRKLPGILAVPMAAATALGLALLIAHFRDALSLDLADAPRAALESLRDTPFGLREVPSWALFGVSLLFALIALADGFGLDDPYPGYGAADRRRKQALDAYLLELDDVRSALQALKDEALADLDRAMAESRAGLQALHEALEQKTATGTRLRNVLADVDNCLDTLLRRFRDINKLHRTTPCPAYFSERPGVADLRRTDFSVDRDRRKYAGQTALLQGFVDRIEGLRSNIQSSFVRHRDGLEPLDAQFEPRKASDAGRKEAA
jgi:NADH:ubiquinone oxidoreductase subunit K